MDDVAACGVEAAAEGVLDQHSHTRRTTNRGWHDTDARRVQDCVLASRLGGGGEVTVAPDGTVTIAVKQSKDCVPPLVKAMQAMRAEGVEVARSRQTAWIEKTEARQQQLSSAATGGQALKSKRALKRRATKDRAKAEREELARLREAAGMQPQPQEQQQQSAQPEFESAAPAGDGKDMSDGADNVADMTDADASGPNAEELITQALAEISQHPHAYDDDDRISKWTIKKLVSVPTPAGREVEVSLFPGTGGTDMAPAQLVSMLQSELLGLPPEQLAPKLACLIKTRIHRVTSRHPRS